MKTVSSRRIHELRRVHRRTADGLIVSYIHFNGRLGAMVEVNCETDFVARTDEFALLAQQLAEQIAAAAPLAVDREQLPRDILERKRRAFEEAVRESGKPEHLFETIVEGKIAAYCRDVVLMEQAWVREPNTSITELVDDVSSKVGEHVRVRRFARFHMGVA